LGGTVSGGTVSNKHQKFEVEAQAARHTARYLGRYLVLEVVGTRNFEPPIHRAVLICGISTDRPITDRSILTDGPISTVIL
jgi:hypothetical protein